MTPLSRWLIATPWLMSVTSMKLSVLVLVRLVFDSPVILLLQLPDRSEAPISRLRRVTPLLGRLRQVLWILRAALLRASFLRLRAIVYGFAG